MSQSIPSELPLHVAFYSPALPDHGSSNGIVTYTRVMRDALRNLGHSVTVITADQIEHQDGTIAQIDSARGLARIGRSLQARSIADGSSPWIRNRLVDAVHAARRAGAHILEMEESFGWAGWLSRHGLPIVERLHGPHVFGREPVETPEQRRLGDLREKAELRSFLRVQAITCPSERLLDAVVDRYHLAIPRARVIPNPMPLAPEADRWNARAANPDQLVCVGRFDLRKGADIVVRAFARALEKKPSLRLVMAGPDDGIVQPTGGVVRFEDFVRSEISPEARSQIQHLANLPRKRLSELRLECGLQIVGSRFENFPYSIAEAMAVGMPVIASDSFGNGEMIRDGVDGLLVPVGDVDALSNAIVEATSNPSLLESFGRHAYDRASDFLSPQRIGQQTVRLYREVLEGIRA